MINQLIKYNFQSLTIYLQLFQSPLLVMNSFHLIHFSYNLVTDRQIQGQI